MFHRHKWESLACYKSAEANYDPRTGKQIGPEAPITEVLQRCEECGNLRNITLEGLWTIEQVKAK